MTPTEDLQKSAKELISEMGQLIGGSPTNPAFNTRTALTALRKFACVLVVVSDKAEKQSQRVVKVTWGLFWLTLLLAAIAAVQIAIMLRQ